MWKMRRRLNWEPPHTTKTRRERTVSEVIPSSMLHKIIQRDLTQSSDIWVLVLFQGNRVEILPQNEVAKLNVVKSKRAQRAGEEDRVTAFVWQESWRLREGPDSRMTR